MWTEILPAISANLLTPAVLFFVLGVVATLVGSDLKFPEPLYVTLTIYLLIAIGDATADGRTDGRALIRRGT